MKYFQQISFPLGWITVTADAQSVVEISFSRVKKYDQILSNDITVECASQIREYLAHERKEFDCPFRLQGTEFQKAVWTAARAIPYGTTVSYGWLARKIGKPGAYRAVANALKRNRLPLIVPCHRIIMSDGSLGGFNSGIDVKVYLLNHEGVTI